MRKSAAKKFESARERLRKMEAAIRPYTDAPSVQEPRRRGEWRPADHAYVRGDGAIRAALEKGRKAPQS